jgi:hypothetical protein
MTDHKDILAQTVRVLHERSAVYGAPRRAFDDAASMASTALKKDLTAYDVAMIMHFVKISRMVTGRGNLDHYEDGINFLAFAAEFATQPTDHPFAKLKTFMQQPLPGVPEEPRVDMDALHDVLAGG